MFSSEEGYLESSTPTAFISAAGSNSLLERESDRNKFTDSFCPVGRVINCFERKEAKFLEEGYRAV